ncbi:hypothetical protein AB1Y20_015093 [Prymnesium parvum]|uniref:Uncharacterized protein n=1 Tax=Prymnesium parvum TaxID=97485 RepID=A0AB34JWU5_PRYPA
MFVRLLQGSLSSELQQAIELAADVYLKEETLPPCSGHRLCSSHWFPLQHGRPARQPHHALETYAASLLDLQPVKDHFGEDISSVVGLEWWLQEQEPEEEPKKFHTDKDVEFDNSECVVERVPCLSSVAYLSDTGGPTAVFNQAKRDGALYPHLPGTVALAFPRRGSLLLFDGALFHGVLHPDPVAAAPTWEQPRRTLLVNFWRVAPSAAKDPAAEEKLNLPRVVHPAIRSESSLEAEHIGCSLLANPLVLDLPRRFCEDAALWRQQRLPPTVADAISMTNNTSNGLSCGDISELCTRFVLVKYCSNSPEDESISPDFSEQPLHGKHWHYDWCD